MPARLRELVAPARLGPSFRPLLASSWTTNVGDGIALAAGPLLVASLTDDARLVALAATLQWLPPLLFGLVAGVAADRLDRRLLVVRVDVARALVLTGLVLAIVGGRASIVVVLAALFLVGIAEVFADTTSATLAPMLVARGDLAVANARLQTGFITLNQLAGPPLGAALFTAGAAWPFGAQALVLAGGAVLMTRVVLPDRPGRTRRPGGPDGPGVPGGPGAPDGADASAAAGDGTAREPSHLRHDIAEGIRWVRHHAAVRTLVLTILIFNVTFGAAWSVLVLYATRRLGMGEVGFGLLTTVSAVGGLVGVALYGALTRRVSLGNLMRVGLVVETLTHLALALTTRPSVALPIFFVFGAHAFIWGTTSTTVRQRAVPAELQGRVGSVNLVGVFGGLVVGSGIGGLLAERWGVVAPFWFAFAGSAVFTVLLWRQLTHVAHADELPDA